MPSLFVLLNGVPCVFANREVASAGTGWYAPGPGLSAAYRLSGRPPKEYFGWRLNVERPSTVPPEPDVSDIGPGRLCPGGLLLPRLPLLDSYKAVIVKARRPGQPRISRGPRD